MAYATSPDTPRTRPGTVTTAVILLYIVVVLEVIGAVLYVVNYSAYKSAYEKTYAGTSLAGQEGSQATINVAAPATVSIILAIVFLVLAILDGRGNRVGRIITWIFGGLAVCCTGAAFALNALGQSLYNSARQQNPDLPSYDTVTNNMNEALPSYFVPVTTIFGIIVVLSIITAAILLALPASNAFFRKRTEPEWQPPVQPPYPSTNEPPYPPSSEPPAPPNP